MTKIKLFKQYLVLAKKINIWGCSLPQVPQLEFKLPCGVKHKNSISNIISSSQSHCKGLNETVARKLDFVEWELYQIIKNATDFRLLSKQAFIARWGLVPSYTKAEEKPNFFRMVSAFLWSFTVFHPNSQSFCYCQKHGSLISIHECNQL